MLLLFGLIVCVCLTAANVPNNSPTTQPMNDEQLQKRVISDFENEMKNLNQRRRNLTALDNEALKEIEKQRKQTLDNYKKMVQEERRLKNVQFGIQKTRKPRLLEDNLWKRIGLKDPLEVNTTNSTQQNGTQ